MIGKVTQCDSVHTLVEPKMYEMLKSYLDFLGVDTEDTDSISPRSSLLRLDEFGAPSGCMLVEEPDDDSVEVSYFVNTGAEEAAIQLVTCPEKSRHGRQETNIHRQDRPYIKSGWSTDRRSKAYL